MRKHLRRAARTLHVHLDLAQIVCSVAIAIFIVFAAVHIAQHAPAASGLKFTDASSRGLMIVPASEGTCNDGTTSSVSDVCPGDMCFNLAGVQSGPPSGYYQYDTPGYYRLCCPNGYTHDATTCYAPPPPADPDPDLTASYVSLANGTFEEGGSTRFSGSVTNNGGATAQTFNNSFEVDIGNDGVWDFWLSGEAQAGLAAGASVSITSGTWSNMPSGTHRVRLCADMPPLWEGSIAESNEDNNCGADTSFTTTAAPPPSCVANAGSSCTGTANACGQTAGTVQCDGSCRVAESTCNNPPACSANQGMACTSAPNACGLTNGTYRCDGTCAPPSESACMCPANYYFCGTGSNSSTLYQRTFSGASCIALDSEVARCVLGCDPSRGACNPTPDLFVNIAAQPTLVRPNYSTTVTWQTSGVASGVTACTIRGTNGDLWSCSGDACTNGSQTSRPITTQTTFTMTCSLDRSVYVNGEPDPVKNVIVNVIPGWVET